MPSPTPAAPAAWPAPAALRRFHIGDLLSVTTGRIVAPRGGPGVAALLRFMAGGHAGELGALLDYVDDFRDAVLAAYPELAAYASDDVPPLEFIGAWLRRRAREFGAYRPAPLLPLSHPLRAAQLTRRLPP